MENKRHSQEEKEEEKATFKKYKPENVEVAQFTNIFDHIENNKPFESADSKVNALLDNNRDPEIRARITLTDGRNIDFMVKNARNYLRVLRNITKNTTYPAVAESDHENDYQYTNSYDGELGVWKIAYPNDGEDIEFDLKGEEMTDKEIDNTLLVLKGKEVIAHFPFDVEKEPASERKTFLFMDMDLLVVWHGADFRVFDISTQLELAKFTNPDIQELSAWYDESDDSDEDDEEEKKSSSSESSDSDSDDDDDKQEEKQEEKEEEKEKDQ